MPSTRTANNAKNQNYEKIIHDVQAGHFKPVYCFMGAESYYIDRLANYVVEQAVAPEQRDFNLIMLYGADAGADKIISAAKSFPMGADRLVVCVKEAQNVKDLDLLAYYLQKPQPTTVLVLCYKNGVLDRRKKLAAELEKSGILFESKKLKESQLPGFIASYLKRRQVEIDGVRLTGAAVNTAGLVEGMTLKGEVGELFLRSHGVDLSPETAVLNNLLLKDTHLSLCLADTTGSVDAAASAPLYWKVDLQDIDLENVSFAMQMPLDSMDFRVKLGKAALRDGLIDLRKSAYTVQHFSIRQGEADYNSGGAPMAEAGLDPSHGRTPGRRFVARSGRRIPRGTSRPRGLLRFRREGRRRLPDGARRNRTALRRAHAAPRRGRHHQRRLPEGGPHRRTELSRLSRDRRARRRLFRDRLSGRSRRTSRPRTAR